MTEQELKYIRKMERIIKSNWFLFPVCITLTLGVIGGISGFWMLCTYLFGGAGFVIGGIVSFGVMNYLMYRIYEG